MCRKFPLRPSTLGSSLGRSPIPRQRKYKELIYEERKSDCIPGHRPGEKENYGACQKVRIERKRVCKAAGIGICAAANHSRSHISPVGKDRSVAGFDGIPGNRCCHLYAAERGLRYPASAQKGGRTLAVTGFWPVKGQLKAVLDYADNPDKTTPQRYFQNKIGDHKELRKISDAICREHGLSVLENSDFYKHEKKAYWLHRQGKKTHRDTLREDVEYCLTYAKNWEQFEKQMVSRGYSIDRVRLSVKAANWQRPVRLSSLGYTKEVLRNRFDENFYSNDFRQKWNTHLPYKPKKFPLEWEMERLAFTIEHSHSTEEVLVDTVLLLLILVIELVLQTTDVMLLSPDLRATAKDLESYRADYRFLQENGIRTITQLETTIPDIQSQIDVLEAERSKTDNTRRRAKTPEKKQEAKDRKKELTQKIAPLRKKLRQAKKILEESPHVYELLQEEHRLEQAAYQRFKERMK